MGAFLLAILAIIILVIVGAAGFGLGLYLLWWAIIGLVFGALGRLIVPGAQPIGILATALVGIAGSLLGGVIARAAHLGGVLQFIIAVVLAAILVAFYSWQSSSRSTAG